MVLTRHTERIEKPQLGLEPTDAMSTNKVLVAPRSEYVLRRSAPGYDLPRDRRERGI